MPTFSVCKQEHSRKKGTESGLEIHSEISEHFYGRTEDGPGPQQQSTGTILLLLLHMPPFL